MIIALIIAFSYGVQALKFIKTKLFSKSALDDDCHLIEFESLDVEFEVAVDGSTYFETDGSFKFAPPVYIQRYLAVVNELENHGTFKKVLELGCSELSFFQYLKELSGVEEAVFVDIDEELLIKNSPKAEPLSSDFLRKRYTPLSVQVVSGNAAIPDKSFFKTDAVVAIELIEHMLPEDLDNLPHCIFGIVQPHLVVVTTPNSEFNVLFTSLEGFRHPDHKFEWSRRQFKDWAVNVVNRYPEYNVYFRGIGPGPEGSEKFGCCSQMAVFERNCPPTSDESLFKDIFKVIRKVVYPFEVEIEVPIEIQIGYECDKFIRYAEKVDEYYTPDGIYIPLCDLLRMVSKISESKELLKEVLRSRKISVKTLECGTEVAVVPLEGLSCDESESTCESDLSSCPQKAENDCDRLYEVQSDWEATEFADGSNANNETCMEPTVSWSDLGVRDIYKNFDKESALLDSNNISKDISAPVVEHSEFSDENVEKLIKESKSLGEINSGAFSFYTDGDEFSPLNKDIDYSVCDNLYASNVVNNFSICSSIPVVSESVIQDINVYCVLGNEQRANGQESGSESSHDERLNIRDFPVTEQVSTSIVKPPQPCDSETQTSQQLPLVEKSLLTKSLKNKSSPSLYSKSDEEKSNSSYILSEELSVSTGDQESTDSENVQLDDFQFDFNQHNSIKVQSSQKFNKTETAVTSDDFMPSDCKLFDKQIENKCYHNKEFTISEVCVSRKEEIFDCTKDKESFIQNDPLLCVIDNEQTDIVCTKTMNSSELEANNLKDESSHESTSIIKEKLEIYNCSEAVTNCDVTLNKIEKESTYLNEMSFSTREVEPHISSENSMDILNKSFPDNESINSSNGTLCADTSVYSSDDSVLPMEDANLSCETLVEESSVVKENQSSERSENISSSIEKVFQETKNDISLNSYIDTENSLHETFGEKCFLTETVCINSSKSLCDENDLSKENFSEDSLLEFNNSTARCNENPVLLEQNLVAANSLMVSNISLDSCTLSNKKIDLLLNSTTETSVQYCSKTTADLNNSAFSDNQTSLPPNSIKKCVDIIVPSENEYDNINSIKEVLKDSSTVAKALNNSTKLIQDEQSSVTKILNLSGNEIVKDLLEDLVTECVKISSSSVVSENKTNTVTDCLMDRSTRLCLEISSSPENKSNTAVCVAEDISLNNSSAPEHKTDIHSTSMNPTTLGLTGLSRCQSLQLIKENSDKKMNRFSLSCEKDNSMGSNYSDFGEHTSIFENFQVESTINMDDSYSLSKAVDSGYPNTSERDMDTDMTPEQVDEISENDSSFEEREEDDNQLIDVPIQGGPAPVHFLDNVENGDVANNNRDDEGNNMDGVEVGEIVNFEQLILNRDEDLQLNDPPHHESDSEDEYKYLSACESLTDETIIQEDDSEQTLEEFDSLYNNSCGWWESTPARPSRQWHFVRVQQESNLPLEMSSTSLIAHTSSGTLNSESSSSRNAIQFGGLESSVNGSFPYWLLNMFSEENATDMAQGDANSAPDLIDELRNDSEPSVNGVEDWAIEEIIPGDMMGGGEPNTHI